MAKPEHLFDRDREWQALEDFVSSDRPGATLGLMHGRRRQGKTFLLETLVETHGGFYFAALQQSGTQNLDRLAEKYRAYTHTRARIRFASWEEAFEALLALGENATGPVVVVLDEFPYLLDGVPELPSILQDLLSPRGTAVQSWRTRLILCGSALSTMRGLLDGTAPLRGRASLELMVHPFGYRDAAAFWRVDGDPDMAMWLHALVGGTPAYRDMCHGTGPASHAAFDEWVATTLLDPASAMFREGNVLLSEEPRVVDTSLYLSVLAAISQGRTRRGQIADAVGRPADALAHPLTVLAEARLVTAQGDAVRQRRTTYQVAEPVLRLRQLVIAPNEARLTRHQGPAVWAEVADTVASRIFGPHFEELARTWCAEHADTATLGGTPSRVAPTVLACPEHGTTHELDVVVTESVANMADTVIAIGEVKWRSDEVGVGQLRRLEHLRALLRAESARLLLFSRSGFSGELVQEAAALGDVELVDVARMYAGG